MTHLRPDAMQEYYRRRLLAAPEVERDAIALRIKLSAAIRRRPEVEPTLRRLARSGHPLAPQCLDALAK